MDSRPATSRQPEPVLPSSTTDQELQELRRLLLSGEIEAIAKLQQRLDDHQLHAQEISMVLAEAIVLRSHRDDLLKTALHSSVEDIFISNLRRNPRDVANILFPVIGPAIRRSIAEIFRSMMQRLHKTLELSFSWKGLRWRWQAWRSGQPFSEIVLLNTLLYRVEQVFLVNTSTGIMLDHLVAEGIQTQDADLVSGMLTAVQQFVVDCFQQGGEDSLESLRMGDMTILVARAHQIYVACVVRGTPPVNLTQQLHNVLESILLESSESLTNFQGDTSIFAPARRHLQELLVSRFVDEKEPPPHLLLRLAPLAVLLALLGGLGYLKYQEHQKLKTIELLRYEPGIVLLQVDHGLWKNSWEIFIMRDALSRDPTEMLTQAGLTHQDFVLHQSPYTSLDDSIVQARVHQAIAVPSQVTVRLDQQHVLHLSGQAPMGWIIVTREKAMAIPGITGVDISQLVDPRRQHLNELIKNINEVVILFPPNKDTPNDDELDKLVQAVDDIVALEKLAQQMDMGVTLTIYGHADAIGNNKLNYLISQERAKTVAALLYARGSSIPIATYGLGADYAAKSEGRIVADASSRKIELRVHLVRQAGEHSYNDF